MIKFEDCETIVDLNKFCGNLSRSQIISIETKRGKDKKMGWDQDIFRVWYWV